MVALQKRDQDVIRQPMIGLRPFGLGGCGEWGCQDGRHGILCGPIDTLVGKIHYKFVVGCIRNIFWKQSLTSIVFCYGQVAYRLQGSHRNGDRYDDRKRKMRSTMASVFNMLFIVTGAFILLGCGEIPNDSDAKHMETDEVVFADILIIGQDEKRGMVFWGMMVNTGTQYARDVSYVLDFEMTGGRLFEGTWSDPIHVPPSVPIRIVGNERIESAFLARIVWKTRWYSLDGKFHEASGQITF